MSFLLDVDTTNVPEFTTLPDGTEAKIRIVRAEVKNAKSSGSPMLALRFDVPDEPLVKDINLNIMLPTNQDDEKTSAQKANRLKTFKLAFGLPASGALSTDMVEGATGWAILGEEDSTEYGMQNKVKKFITG